MNAHLESIRAGEVSKTTVIGLRKAINAQARRDRGLSVSMTAPALQGDELAEIERELADREPLVTGELHESGLRLLQGKRYAKQVDSVADLVPAIEAFRLVRFDRFGSGDLHCVPVYRACAPGGNFLFRNIPWQSGGNGPEIISASRSASRRDLLDSCLETNGRTYPPGYGFALAYLDSDAGPDDFKAMKRQAVLATARALDAGKPWIDDAAAFAKAVAEAESTRPAGGWPFWLIEAAQVVLADALDGNAGSRALLGRWGHPGYDSGEAA